MTTAAEDTTNELRVSGTTSTQELAAAISHAIYNNHKVTLRAIGAGAVNQAVKGIIVAQGFTAQRGLILATRPGFLTVPIGDQERTATVFNVFVM